MRFVLPARCTRKLGLGRNPVMVAKGWSEALKRAYTLADNKLTRNGGWADLLLVCAWPPPQDASGGKLVNQSAFELDLRATALSQQSPFLRA
jgi:hypothetical protein